MKKLFTIFALCLAVSCRKNQAPQPMHSSCISIIDDRTDPFALHPLPEPILALYDFQNDKDQEATARLVLITDKLLNPVQEIHLQDGRSSEAHNANDEIDNREQLVYSYCDAFTNAVNGFHKRYAPDSTLNHSECFATIASELEYLFKNPALQKTLIVFSDLQENSDVFSCYTAKGQRLLCSNTKKVEQLLQSRHPLPENLVGITIYFVYQPPDREHDQQFSKMLGIYKKLLNERGARVVVQAQNSYYQP
jgi:hypothetical protein